MRPLFHYTAETGWINDPHGITFKDGKYHLFYQYVPGSLVWASNCHWGHAASTDLFDWKPRPVALAPGDGDDGIWTGSLVTDDAGKSTIFYTSVVKPDIGIGRVRQARPVDADWNEWVKGPVVAVPPADLDIIAYRDPFVFKENDAWTMLLGAGLADGTAVALSYRSTDLDNWTYTHIAAQRSTRETDPVWTGALWECPQIFELDGRHVLVSSVWDNDVLHYVAYGVGNYSDGVFTAHSWGQLSFGPSYYAPSLFRDADGVPCLSFWMRGVTDPEAGWASAHSVPHSLSLDGDTLVATVHAGLDAYRVPTAASNHVEGTAADAIWNPADSARLAVKSSTGEAFSLEWQTNELVMRSQDGQWSMPYHGDKVRIVVDGPCVEISTTDGVMASAVDIREPGLEFTATGTLELWQLER